MRRWVEGRASGSSLALQCLFRQVGSILNAELTAAQQRCRAAVQPTSLGVHEIAHVHFPSARSCSARGLVSFEWGNGRERGEGKVAHRQTDRQTDRQTRPRTHARTHTRARAHTHTCSLFPTARLVSLAETAHGVVAAPPGFNAQDFKITLQPTGRRVRPPE